MLELKAPHPRALRLRTLRACLLGAFVVCAVATQLLWSAPVSAKERVHTVYSGQRLGSIAKRYNVTIAELCARNGIRKSDPIKPGQKLIIPGKDGESAKESEKKEKTSPAAAKGKESVTGKPKIHVVAKGHTLSAIAGRYRITVTALCHANGISRTATLNVGERLIVPHPSDKDGSDALARKKRGFLDESDEADQVGQKADKSGRASWEQYVKPAWKRGYIKIRRYGRSWEGYVIGPKEQVLGYASNKINFVMGAKEDGPRIDGRLIRLIAHVSDKFGGRELRIVSGYRTKSFVAASKHKQGRALDFSIPGVPNEALRDYLRTLDNVGVGYYPNSSFVHLDVRGYNSYWVDYAGPGEAPKKRSGSKKKSANSSKKSSGPSPDSDDAESGGADGAEAEEDEAPSDDVADDPDAADESHHHGDDEDEPAEG